jgi:hypothetical protein
VNGQNIKPDPSLADVKKQLHGDIDALVENINNNNRKLKGAMDQNLPDLFNEAQLQNKELIKGAEGIKDKTNAAIEKAKDLSEQLDNLLDVLPKIEDDIDLKYQMIQEADEIFERLNQVIDDEIFKNDEQLSDVEGLIALIEGDFENETDPEVIKELKDKLANANALKDRLKKRGKELENDKKTL